MRYRPLLIGAVALVAAVAIAAGVLRAVDRPATAAVETTGPGTPAGWRPPPVRHVFLIVLENQDYGATFGDPSADPYLARTLRRRGALLTQYYAIGHNSLDNYLAIVSGQPPNPETQDDCPVFLPWRGTRYPGTSGVLAGHGCVFPPSVATIGNQLNAIGLSWRAYLQDMGNDPSRESPVCGRPLVGHPDPTETAVPGDGYAARHDPFVYFESVIGARHYCDVHVIPLGSSRGRLPRSTPPGVTGLATDLRSVATTPNFSLIVPDLCFDGHDYPCINTKGKGSALADIQAFLRTWVPRITSSPAFRRNGLLEITFDESGDNTDSRACCGEVPGPNVAKAGITGPGGGRVGAVLLSPFIRPDTRTSRPYNHYSTLASIEELFGLPRLAEARTVTTTFGPDVYTRALGVGRR